MLLRKNLEESIAGVNGQLLHLKFLSFDLNFTDVRLESFDTTLDCRVINIVWPDLLVVFWVCAIVIAIGPQPQLKQEIN